MPSVHSKCLYIFLDESGNFDFSENGTARYVITALSVFPPFPYSLMQSLTQLKHKLWQAGVELEYFHAAEDKQATRDEVFARIHDHLHLIRCDSIVVEKRKTQPHLRADLLQFYKKIVDILISYVLEGARRNSIEEIHVVADSIPIKALRKPLEGALKARLSQFAALNKGTYSISWVSSKSEIMLQVTDYISWAIYRKWEKSDLRSYDIVSLCIKSEFDVFRFGTMRYY
jgi:hypothetical protein